MVGIITVGRVEGRARLLRLRALRSSAPGLAH